MFYRDEGMAKLPCTPISSVIPFGTNVANISFSSLNFTCALMAAQLVISFHSKSADWNNARRTNSKTNHAKCEREKEGYETEDFAHRGLWWGEGKGGQSWKSRKIALRVSMSLYTLANFHFSSPLWFYGQQFNCDDMYDAGHSPSSSATWHI